MEEEIIGYAPNKYYILIPILLNIFINLIFVFLDFKKILNKNKNKLKSLDKFLFPLSILEILIFLIWCCSGFLQVVVHDDSTGCRILGMFQIFFYVNELLLIHGIISHLKHLIMNPLNYILKSNKQLCKSLIKSLLTSLIIAIVCFIMRITGKSPIATCFFRYEFLEENKLPYKIVFTIIIMLPFFVIVHAISKISILTRSNTYESDSSNKKLFQTHIAYLFIYLLIFPLFPILYLTFAIKKENPDWTFNFVMTLLMILFPLISGIIRLYKTKITSKKVSLNPSENNLSQIGLLNISEDKEKECDDDDELEEKEQIELFEASAIKKFVMNFYISVCFCLEKNSSHPILLFNDLTDDMNNDKNIYTITKNIISKELPNGELIKDPMVNSRENFSIKCIEYAPKIFSYLRESDDVPEEMVIKSMLPKNNKIGIKETEGKGGSFFVNTDDSEFILKTITQNEFNVMLSLLQNKMVHYYKNNKNSIICRIYGVYKISIQTGLIKNDEIYFILMKNVIGSFSGSLICKYDLKGSSLNRKVQYENMDKNVMKDINFNEVENVFMLNKEDSKKLLEIVEKDSNFLYSQGIMDYSLLVAKISLNNSEIVSLFGKNHRRNSEKQFLELLGKESKNALNPNIKKESKVNQEEEDDYNIMNDSSEIRFKEGNIASLRKYIFPSLKADVMYILSIIDYFQLFTLQKNLENRYKKFKTGVKKEAISSIPPKEYRDRFIEFVKQKTDSEHYLQELYNPQNQNDF